MAIDIRTKKGQATGGVTQNDTLFCDDDGALKIVEQGFRFSELNKRGQLFTVGSADTALVSANAAATGLTATAQPIIGLFNPLGSGIDIFLLKTFLAITLEANSAVNPKGFHYYVGSAGNNPISTGTANGGLSLKTLLAGKSQATTFTGGGTALTGLVGNLVLLKPVEISPVVNAAGAATAVPLPQGIVTDYVEGSIKIAPGQLLAILNNASVTTVDVSAALTWAELPATN